METKLRKVIATMNRFYLSCEVVVVKYFSHIFFKVVETYKVVGSLTLENFFKNDLIGDANGINRKLNKKEYDSDPTTLLTNN